IGRAIPDVRDGLKPVHRRVLFAMRELKNDFNKPYKKSARVVGDTIGKYHPHGDTAVYDTVVRMAQDFSMRYPLVDGQGNFGSIDGDPPAAMRYTEVRMQRLAHEMLEDLDKETVDFIQNYDESLEEPSVLPARMPNLLVNGSSGIAVGMATNIPPHNLGEIVDSLCAIIDNPEIGPREILSIMPGPDFPTGGIIYGVTGIRNAYSTGRGILKIRARITVEKEKRTEKETLVVSELPYMVNKARVIEKIAELMKDKVLDGISFVRDESDRQGMRIAMGLKRDAMSGVVVNQLYKHTQLESTFGVIILAIVNQQPQVLNIKDALSYFISHRKQIVTRRTQYELKKAKERAHILEGLKIALDNLDEVVALIRRSATPALASEGLQERFNLTKIQAQAILDMRLQRLTGLERDKILEEYRQIIMDIARYEEILANEHLVLEIIRTELLEIKEKYADERRTEIVSETTEISIEDMIVEEDMVVTITQRGYIKRTPLSQYQSQRRGGKGKLGAGTSDEDFVCRLFVASTHNTFLFFTSTGRVYWRKVYEIPAAGRATRGKAIVNLLNLSEGESVATVLNVSSFDPGYFVIMATKKGLVKKTDLLAYANPRTTGIIALNLADGDELISVRISDGTQNIFLGSASGKSIRFHESDVRATGRVSQGVIGVRLAKKDHIVGMEVLVHGKTLLTCTQNGFGKRTLLDEYPLQKRGGQGVITIKTGERNGPVVAVLVVADEDDVMLMTDAGKIIRMPVADISLIGRNTMGVKLMGMQSEERLIGAARLADKED
ncbi:MAG: DNA gyrase subunit A, partial [Desulfatibacillaceae bacterium]|nr:DNA gyrase subunit A [Desulfatibacillaceae bacterium]